MNVISETSGQVQTHCLACDRHHFISHVQTAGNQQIQTHTSTIILLVGLMMMMASLHDENSTFYFNVNRFVWQHSHSPSEHHNQNKTSFRGWHSVANVICFHNLSPCSLDVYGWFVRCAIFRWVIHHHNDISENGLRHNDNQRLARPASLLLQWTGINWGWLFVSGCVGVRLVNMCKNTNWQVHNHSSQTSKIAIQPYTNNKT